MPESFQYRAIDEWETLALGGCLARATFQDPGLKPEQLSEPGCKSRGAVIFLQGDLGAGKTTLARGFLRGYGFQGAVKSPTYTLVEPYEFASCSIYHFDLYRLSTPEDAAYLGIDEYFKDETVCLVEWPERGVGWLPLPDLSIKLNGAGTDREFEWQGHSSKGREAAERLWQFRRNL
ncbi:MAG: tRNA (adenosine(37)-N6)-threonylcarbamoyltransferase complex ATPase subunit type 1 TsaE [Gammaproteobacteria bacterium]|nr:tRNA (adenosine(37)-N6)-threonylcarbamoyltransferase complex ATPase subunit type 1 TsaE [Gammaproteobacteria bacterium]HBW85097.1 tRNA (adenosine(37)-N6)-threonylcarbamoyltransferase complex ATPase subunit type 1 TsaE [Gammaproteobacteria bacterium]|tara:strand:+ start:1535 stop:2065 length:531 start_codon:yes stop_codon:yes gene_type:complete